MIHDRATVDRGAGDVRRLTGWAVGGAIGGVVATAPLVALFGNGTDGLRLSVVALTAGAIALVAIIVIVTHRSWSVRDAAWAVALGFWVLVAGLALCNGITGTVTLQAYGDKAIMARLLNADGTFTRWLVGFTLLRWAFAAFTELPPLRLLVGVPTAHDFIRFSGIFVMGIATTAILWRWRGRLSVVFATLIPLWFVFSSGYLEYYPLAAWAIVACLGWAYLEPTPIDAWSPYAVGAVCAGLPLLYIGYLPLSACMFAIYLSARPRLFAKVTGASVLAFVAIVSLCWGTDLVGFARMSYWKLHFPDVWTIERYVGHYEAGSNYFRASYALSAEHLLDVLYMYLFGGGLLFLPIGAVGALALWRARPWPTLSVADRRLLVLGLVLTGLHLYYMLFFVARLGPHDDIDLFFSTFLVMAFFAGHTIDRSIDEGRLPERAALATIALVVGNLVVVLPLLAVQGLPGRS